ncbi:hypothetical protein [Microbacterium testaceum]|uniref:hypothetical protein n=1 Tax=Microbacterium testaceum TaxID=2033 RepID=UPI0024351F05|nr:hypothetical protein [Microbacterium testaceum]
MADPSPSRDGLAQIADQINALWRAIGELKAPSGTQQANAVAQLEAAVIELQAQQAQITAQQEVIVDLVDGIQQTLTDFIANDVAAIVNDAVNAKLASSDITIGTANGVVRIPSIFNTDVVATLRPRVAVWANDQGVVGHT